MKKVSILIFAICTLIFFSCRTHQTALLQTPTDDGKIEFVFLQVNDTYEIAPLGGGKIGGMARVATLKKQLLAKNPNTFVVHAGDFMNPSLMGTIKYEGNRLSGKQMVEAMNAVGFDLVAFGNHEFDIKEADLQKRLNESEFEYIATNLQQRCGDRLYPFYKQIGDQKHFYPETYTWEISDADGTQIKVGFFSATIDSNPKDYVVYEDAFAKASAANKKLKTTTDVVIGLTHLNIKDDLALAKAFQNVPLIMGGHDHDNMHHEVGKSVVTKADANAKTAYVHTLVFDKNTQKSTLKSELVHLDESIAFEPNTQAVVDKWNAVLKEKISEIVPNPNEVIHISEIPFDGRESTIRNKQSNLGDLITTAMLAASKAGADAAIMNGGSVRIDDQISGNITAVDIFRTMPFGGGIMEVEMTGVLLSKVLTEGVSKKGTGSYLQRKGLNFSEKDKQWLIGGQPVEPKKKYTIALNDYLMRGKDISFLKEGAEGVLKIHRPNAKSKLDFRNDIRVAVIEYLKKL